MNQYYLWKAGETQLTIFSHWGDACHKRYDYYFVYDSGEVEPEDRWGTVLKNNWCPRDVNSIPAEFKTLLLINGAFQ
jgi:hypothetical protein